MVSTGAPSSTKRVLILVDSLATGGHTSSLLSLLERWSATPGCPEIDVVTLSEAGAAASLVPPTVRVGPARWRWSHLRYGRVLRGLVTGNLMLSLVIRLRRRWGTGEMGLESVMRLSQRFAQRQVRALEPLPGRYDVAIAWSEGTALYALVDKVRATTKLAWIHPDYRQARYDPGLDEPYLAQLDAVVAVSGAGRDSLTAAFPHLGATVWVVRNLVDSHAVIELSRAGLAEDSVHFDTPLPTLLTVCRLHDQSKALYRAIELCAALKEAGSPVRWIVVGDGPDRAGLAEAVRAADLVEEFRLIGARSNPYPHMAAADLFVLQSYYEGMPVAVDEALAVGGPVLVTDYAAAREQVTDGVDGWVVPNDFDSLFARLAQVAADPDILTAVRGTRAPDLPRTDDLERLWEVVR